MQSQISRCHAGLAGPGRLKEEELLAEVGAGLVVQDLAHQECQLVGVLAGSGDAHGARPVPVQVAQLEGQPGGQRGKNRDEGFPGMATDPGSHPSPEPARSWVSSKGWESASSQFTQFTQYTQRAQPALGPAPPQLLQGLIYPKTPNLRGPIWVLTLI